MATEGNRRAGRSQEGRLRVGENRQKHVGVEWHHERYGEGT